MLAPAEFGNKPLENAASVPGHLVTTLLLARREISEKLVSPWLFLILTAAFLGVYAFGWMFQKTFETESVLVSRDPLLLLNTGLAAALGIVLGLRLSASIAWEREHRTLEVLLVGPVSWPVLVVSKFISEFTILIVVALAHAAYLLAAQPMGAGVVGLADAINASLAMLLVLPFLGCGLVVSSFSRTVRSAVICYMVVVMLFAGFDAAHAILIAIPPNELSLAALYGRAATEAIAPFVEFMSPTHGVTVGARVLLGGTTNIVMTIVQVIGLSVAMILFAILVGSKRGVGR